MTKEYLQEQLTQLDKQLKQAETVYNQTVGAMQAMKAILAKMDEPDETKEPVEPAS